MEEAQERDEDPIESVHELHEFFGQLSDSVASEYARIRRRTRQDPGTAGDEGEANWARLVLEPWLPVGYHVVTKGRILSSGRVDEHGRRVRPELSPQIDVLVLSPSYPKFLLEQEKHVYLADGVVAGFECKNTLKAKDLEEAAKTAAFVRRLTEPREGDPYRELFGAPIYGVLAHSHSWKGEGSDPIGNIERKLFEGMRDAGHPRDLLDVVCVADLATWWAFKMPWIGPPRTPDESWLRIQRMLGLPAEGCVKTNLNRHDADGSPLMVLMAVLLRRMAWEDVALRPIARYFENVEGPKGGGPAVHWGLGVYSPKVTASIVDGWFGDRKEWNPWDAVLM
ncbi:DUF6602 domain-containing protein [Embleya sp. NPDC050493]|uniref:DUF6602 domain-containing protein n=1 Tax=Embleya sp. NPDC050493 TaxID=3363989 RepID=UPI0037A9DC2A